MKKSKVSLTLLSIFISITIILFGFVTVDKNVRRTCMNDNRETFEIITDSKEFLFMRFTFLGKDNIVNLSGFLKFANIMFKK